MTDPEGVLRNAKQQKKVDNMQKGPLKTNDAPSGSAIASYLLNILQGNSVNSYKRCAQSKTFTFCLEKDHMIVVLGRYARGTTVISMLLWLKAKNPP